MFDFTAAANAMYPTANHETPAAPTLATAPTVVVPIQSTEAQMASALYPEKVPAKIDDAPNEDVKALRNAPERLLYPAQVTFREAISDTILDHIDAPSEVRAAAVANFRELAADLSLSTDDARALVSASMLPAPDEATSAAWRAESLTALKDAYGDQAHAALADAKLLVQRDSRVRNFLNASGLGDSPSVVLMLAGKARDMRVRGRLR